VNTSFFRSSVMLLALLPTGALPVIAQQRRSSDVQMPVVMADDPGTPAPLPPPPDPSFALHF
jgi:hypothetical protein